MATLTINFTPSSSAPVNGYLVSYRQAGDSVYTEVSPNPTSSPVVIPNVDGTKAYEGFIQSVCNAQLMSDPVQFSVGALAVLDNFDYLVLRYKNDGGGTDLDTFTGFADNGLSLDINYDTSTNWVGYGGSGSTSGYIKWGGDNQTGGGVEAVLIDFKKLINDFPAVGNGIRVRLHAWWYTSRSTGNVQLELQTWLGGAVPALVESQYDFVKTDGTTVDDILLDTNVTCVKHTQQIAVKYAQKLAEIIYDKVNKTAVLVPLSGDCSGPPCYNYTLTNNSDTTDSVDFSNCDGSPNSVDVNPGTTRNICAQEGTLFILTGFVEVTQGSSC